MYGGGVKPNLSYLSLYNYDKPEFDPRYIPDDLYYGTIDPYFNKALDCAAIDDKNLYDLYFPDAPQPKTIVRKIRGQYQDSNYRIISFDSAVELCAQEAEVVIKKAVGSDGGHGIRFWKLSDGKKKVREILKESDYDIVVQETIKQHESLAKLHPSSVNSIRMLTLTRGGEVQVLSSIVRMGANGNNVDNGHSGGIFVGVDGTTGQLKNVAYTYMTGKRFETKHPTTGAVFSDSMIPNFDKCKDLVKRLSPRLSRVSCLTSWDLSVGIDGEPILIEVNMAYGGLFFHQITNGPVFGDMTKEIIEEVFLK